MAMSGGVFGHHKHEADTCVWVSGVKDHAAAQHPTNHRTVFPMKNYLAPNVNKACEKTSRSFTRVAITK